MLSVVQKLCIGTKYFRLTNLNDKCAHNLGLCIVLTVYIINSV
jgi:hypothetical protein